MAGENANILGYLLRIANATEAGGVAGAPGGPVVTVQGVSGGTPQNVQGQNAALATFTGNTLGIGGVISSTAPTAGTTGQKGDAWFSINGALVVGGVSVTAADGSSNAIVGLPQANLSTGRILGVAGYVLNSSSTWDRMRGDTTGTFTKANPQAGTDRSITATTTSQQLMAANTTRTKFLVKNDTLIDAYINIGATAVATAGGGNIKIAASGGYIELTGTNSAINIIAASTTAAITSREM